MEILAVSPEVLHDELEQAEAILTKWKKVVSGGIPGLEMPSTDDAALVRFLTELGGELLLVAGKCESLSNIITERTVSG